MKHGKPLEPPIAKSRHHPSRQKRGHHHLQNPQTLNLNHSQSAFLGSGTQEDKGAITSGVVVFVRGLLPKATKSSQSKEDAVPVLV